MTGVVRGGVCHSSRVGRSEGLVRRLSGQSRRRSSQRRMPNTLLDARKTSRPLGSSSWSWRATSGDSVEGSPTLPQGLDKKKEMWGVPTIYTGSVLLPTATGVLRIYEQKYLEAFRELGEGGMFAQSLSSNSAPETIKAGKFSQEGLEVKVLGKGISVGTLNCVTKIVPGPTLHVKQGEIEVHYECLQRVCISGAMGHLSKTTPLHDEPSIGEPMKSLERELWKTISEIEKLEKALGRPNASLPMSLIRVAPPREERTAFFAHRHEHQAAIWRGEVVKPRAPTAVKSKGSGCRGAYDHLLEESSLRQELFAYAAALLVAESMSESLALLTSKSTTAKLEWTMEAALPYLNQLRVEHNMYKAVNAVSENKK